MHLGGSTFSSSTAQAAPVGVSSHSSESGAAGSRSLSNRGPSSASSSLPIHNKLNGTTTTTATTTLASDQQEQQQEHLHHEDDVNHKNPLKKKSRRFLLSSWTSMIQVCFQWSGFRDFVTAQCQMAIILGIAYVGNSWPESYPRNDNRNPHMFWAMNAALLVAGLVTLTHDPNASSRGVQILSRNQTEEWKGWMQWAFIMYHYYRMYEVYNAIRVFVSSYVWMTGFGNFLYFDKKKDFSIERAVSMWLRINYFPLLLSVFVGVNLDLFYIVPLHTTAFFITMATCYVATLFPEKWSSNTRNLMAIALCGVVHVVFYETSLVNTLETYFSYEIKFRFSSDKYSAWIGILSGYMWSRFTKFFNWAYNHNQGTASASIQQTISAYMIPIMGVVAMVLWWTLFGHIQDKYTYNETHPFVFWLPLGGWLMLRNGSKYLTELHATALEFFGRITLETYVLQFHVFMCREVQYIPVIIPGSGKDGPLHLKILNMLVTGIGFVALAYWARQVTITTQNTVTELVADLVAACTGKPRGTPPPAAGSGGSSKTTGAPSLESKQSNEEGEELVALTRSQNGAHNADAPVPKMTVV